MSTGFDSIRNAVLESGSDSRVEVNQRALIDKILARYASAGAVYRELLQNSNDAEARTAEVHFSTVPTPKGQIVSEVVYRNDGLPFRPQDWSRLRKIAEGNPDVSKVGAFGVGAYTMFSICEEPMVVSGGQAMAFEWKGDALWVRLASSPAGKDRWTSFVLPSRDPYPMPDLVQFGQFLCASLTFTNCLLEVHVFVDQERRLSIGKSLVGEPRIVTPPKASSWWSGDGAVTTSPRRIFTLGRQDGSITETTVEMSVDFEGESAKVQAKYVSAMANTRVPADMARRMERVTKKRPPPQVKVEIFIDANASLRQEGLRKNRAAAITDAFSPKMGAGRIFIGFRTSQTTGLAAHLAAPLLPTVEREAIDFQDPTLRVYNVELLTIAGIVVRLILEHSMSLVATEYAKSEPERTAFEENEKKEAMQTSETNLQPSPREPEAESAKATESRGNSSLFSFARFMSTGVKKIADVISSVDFMRDGDEDMLRPPDRRPLSKEEHEAILLMRSFSPQHSTPDSRVGEVLASGFEACFPGLSPPVLTRSGVVRGTDSRLPHKGIEGFVKHNVIRAVVLTNAEDYLIHVAGCRRLNLQDLRSSLREMPLSEDDLVRLLRWWTKYARIDPTAIAQGSLIKQSVSFFRISADIDSVGHGEKTASNMTSLKTVEHYRDTSKFLSHLPMPDSVLPTGLQNKIPSRVLTDRTLESWFTPLPFQTWAAFVCSHPCLTDGKGEDADIRLNVLTALSQEYSSQSGSWQTDFGRFLNQKLSAVRCIPFDGEADGELTTDFPRELYLGSAELAIFHGLGSFRKVSASLGPAGVSDAFLLVLGVRKTISMDFLFTQLDRLKWNRNPKPLITYLRSVSLTAEDLQKLKTTQYLPEVRDKTRTYAPFELYLPSPELEILPFVKILQWPSTDLLHERSPDAQFLRKLGCNSEPPLENMISFLKASTTSEGDRMHALAFVRKRLGPAGAYERSYSSFLSSRFLPAIVEDPLCLTVPKNELQAPNGCYSDSECACLGFPVLDPALVRRGGRGFAEAFRCTPRPPPNHLVDQILVVLSNARRALSSGNENAGTSVSEKILRSFDKIFTYMSARSTELDRTLIARLARVAFIPHSTGQLVNWSPPSEIYFKNENSQGSELTETLFLVTTFSPFLAAVGVKSEPSTEDILKLMVSSPHSVLQKLGSEPKYRTLLRRIAADTSRPITREMRNSPFLLGFRIDDNIESSITVEDKASARDGSGPAGKSAKYTLARAENICIIDNSHFSRLFNVLSAPQESDLERFYETLGSTYISKKVEQKYTAVGGQRSNTPLTMTFLGRIRERRPLLLSNIVSSPLVRNAAALLDDDQLDVYEVSKVQATYTYNGVVKTQFVTCSASAVAKKRLSLFVTQDFDWFDVGNAIGGVILVKCNVQDAFFIGSLLEAPLAQLRQRGFPVDRILQGSEPIEKSTERDVWQLRQQPSVGSSSRGLSEDGFETILKQMFPDCDPEHIRKLLGENPTLDTVRKAADALADGKYPQKETKAPGGRNQAQGLVNPSPHDGRVRNAVQPSQSQNRGSNSRKGNTNNALSRAFRGIGAGLASIKPSTPSQQPETTRGNVSSRSGNTGGKGQTFRHTPDPADFESVRPPKDKASQTGLEGILRNSVRSSRPVSAGGISSPAAELVSIPESVERNATTCEKIPSADLKPFDGPHKNGKTTDGIRVFASSKRAESEAFLASKWQSVERFSSVLITLCSVYDLRLDTIAIFHEPAGQTIAFNSGRALYFNFRFFASLHENRGRPLGMECYSYWFTTMAHELAHNLASAHAKKHGYYTEGYVSTYMPKLITTLSQRGIR